MNYFYKLVAITLSLFLSYNSFASEEVSKSNVLLKSDVEWEQLNPARGDASPQAANLWGVRTEKGPAGFLLKPKDGFRSPPHIHNISYRGVVISGLLHNDDPAAADMWMESGSYWTQPAGEVHITAAKGDNTLAYIEVDDDFGVLHAHKAFDSGEKPVNVDISNIVWVDYAENNSNQNVKVAYLWDKINGNKSYGLLIKLPKKFSGYLQTNASTFHAVVIKGNLEYQDSENPKLVTLEAGSYFGSKGDSKHKLSRSLEETIIYIRADDKFRVFSDKKKNIKNK